MKLAIMQPYLFPYLGYFQLIAAADQFVVYDDVNYINRGWINRNNILVQGNGHLITLNIVGASQNKLINEISVGSNQQKLLKTISQAYSKAPQFETVFPLLEEILLQKEENLAKFLLYSLTRICDYLGLTPKWHISSELAKDNALKGAEKIIAICEMLHAQEYINPMGGKALYDEPDFAAKGMLLAFLQPKPITYRQFGSVFVPHLSIIDVMMFNSKDEIRKNLMGQFDLVQ
jgi:hypothetical protein